MPIVRNHNYNRMRIQIGQNQCLTKGLYNSIMAGAQDAVRFLPSEDKINLALGLVQAPCVDDAEDTKQIVVQLQEALQAATDTITRLQASNPGTSPSP